MVKNVSGQFFFFEILDSSGDPVTSGIVTGLVTKDGGAQGAIGGTITHLGSGQYRCNLSQADTNGDAIGFLFTHATGVPISLSFETEVAAPAATALSGTWSYDPTQMSSATAGNYTGSTVGIRNQIRWVIQDNQSARPLMVDAEIDWAQTLEENRYMAAAFCCEVLVARAGNISNKHVGALGLTYDVEFYRGLAATLRARGMSHQVPYCGGISVDDKMDQQDDSDWVPPRFFRGMFDNSRATQPNAGAAINQTGYNSPGAY